MQSVPSLLQERVQAVHAVHGLPLKLVLRDDRHALLYALLQGRDSAWVQVWVLEKADGWSLAPVHGVQVVQVWAPADVWPTWEPLLRQVLASYRPNLD